MNTRQNDKTYQSVRIIYTMLEMSIIAIFLARVLKIGLFTSDIKLIDGGTQLRDIATKFSQILRRYFGS